SCPSWRRCSATGRCAMRSRTRPTRRRFASSWPAGNPTGSRMLQVNVARLHDDNREALSLAWIAGREGGSVVRREAAAQAALIGHLNLTHPYSIQVIGAYEAEQANRQNAPRRAELAQRLVANKPALIVFADGVPPFPELVQAATAEGHTAVLASP